jgi:hypothetical protein
LLSHSTSKDLVCGQRQLKERYERERRREREREREVEIERERE